MVEAIPSINRILNIREPTALPRASPESPFFAATIDVTSSGRYVPIATKVSQTSVSHIPRDFAIRLA